MIIEGKFTVKAPIKKLWDTLFDVQALAACFAWYGEDRTDR